MDTTPGIVDYLPHPITTGGREHRKFEHGSLLSDVMHDLPDGRYTAVVGSVDGLAFKQVERDRWDEIVLDEDTVVQIRAMTAGNDEGTNPIAVVASLAIAFSSFGVTSHLLSSLFGFTKTEGALFWVSQATYTAAGVLLVNLLFPPRLPKLVDDDQRRQYELNAGRNRIRKNEPMLIVLGTHRVFPDYASLPYTEFGSPQPAAFGVTARENEAGEANTYGFDENGNTIQLSRLHFSAGQRKNDTHTNQFLNALFDFGLGDLEITNYRLGETLLSEYQDVLFQNSAPVTLFAGNVDTIDGGDLESNVGLVRTTADETVRIAIDFVCQYIEVERNGDVDGLTMRFSIEHRLADQTPPATWTSTSLNLTSPNGIEGRSLIRRTHTFDVPSGAHDVRITLLSEIAEDDRNKARKTLRAAATQIKAYQPQRNNFDGRNPYALRIRASEQLHGTVEILNADVSQMIDIGGVRTKTSNPADIYTAWLKGWKLSDGRLSAGMGIPESKIDTVTIARWYNFCAANDLECNIVIDSARSDREVLNMITSCGWGSVDLSGGVWSVVWENADQPTTSVFTPSNIVAGSVSIAYNNESVADEIVGTFFDRDSDYVENNIDRLVPETETPQFTTTIPLDGITDGTHAAKEVNRTAANQHYHRRSISWETTEEGFFVSRGDVVGMSHGLIGGSSGGRFIAINSARNQVVVSNPPDETIETMWIWTPDDDVKSLSVTEQTGEGIAPRSTWNLSEPLDAPVGHPTEYRYMGFSSSDSPVKVRITGIEPLSNGGYRIIARDEVADYYSARISDLDYDLVGYDGDYTRITDIIATDTIEELENGRYTLYLNIAVAMVGKPVSALIRVNKERVGTIPYGETLKIPSPAWSGQITISALPILGEIEYLENGETSGELGQEYSEVYVVRGFNYPPGPPSGYSVFNDKGVLSHYFAHSTDPATDRYVIRYFITALEFGDTLPESQFEMYRAAGGWDAMTLLSDDVKSSPFTTPTLPEMNGKVVIFAIRSANSKGTTSTEDFDDNVNTTDVAYAIANFIPQEPENVITGYNGDSGVFEVGWDGESDERDNLYGWELELRIGDDGPWKPVGVYPKEQTSVEIPWVTPNDLRVQARVRGVSF